MLDAIMAQCRNTALIMGVIALVGLLLQKKSATDVMSGTMKTVIGFMVFNIGSNAMSACVTTFTDLFNAAFGIEGVTTQVEVATGLALDTYGTEVALVMVLGFVANLIFAKFTPFKAIFLTGQHFLYFACVIALILAVSCSASLARLCRHSASRSWLRSQALITCPWVISTVSDTLSPVTLESFLESLEETKKFPIPAMLSFRNSLSCSETLFSQ